MIKKTNIPVFNFNLYFCQSLEDYIKIERRGHVKEELNGESLGYCNSFMIKAQASTVIGVFDKNPATLAHECGHAVFRILMSRDIPINIDNDEIFCYLFEFIFGFCYKVMEKEKESPGRVSPQSLQADRPQGHHDKSARSKDLHGGADVSSVSKGED